MMREQFTQGTIIVNVRSAKYKGIKCKGVVISARCDLAQKKIKHFHYLTALPLDVWVYEELYYKLIEDVINSEEGSIKKFAERNGLDYETLKEFGYEKSLILLNKIPSIKDVSNTISRIEKCIQYSELNKCNDIIIKKQHLKEYFSEKTVKDQIKKLINGSYPKYSFVPQKAYMNNDVLNDGIVVDLQDINQLEISLAARIVDNELDYQLIDNQMEREKINSFFFFENTNDFVISEGIINSPWIEYVLQQFAHSFIRIGVDNATQGEIDEFYDDFIKEDER